MKLANRGQNNEFECPQCHFFCSKKKAMVYQNLMVCPTCYRHLTAPTVEDILRAILVVKVLSNRRHEMLWAKQIQANKSNASPIGTPATQSMKVIDENIDATISAIVLHHKITTSEK